MLPKRLAHQSALGAFRRMLVQASVGVLGPASVDAFAGWEKDECVYGDYIALVGDRSLGIFYSTPLRCSRGLCAFDRGLARVANALVVLGPFAI